MSTLLKEIPKYLSNYIYYDTYEPFTLAPLLGPIGGGLGAASFIGSVSTASLEY